MGQNFGKNVLEKKLICETKFLHKYITKTLLDTIYPQIIMKWISLTPQKNIHFESLHTPCSMAVLRIATHPLTSQLAYWVKGIAQESYLYRFVMPGL